MFCVADRLNGRVVVVDCDCAILGAIPLTDNKDIRLVCDNRRA
jgi:hypothetical protein